MEITFKSLLGTAMIVVLFLFFAPFTNKQPFFDLAYNIKDGFNGSLAVLNKINNTAAVFFVESITPEELKEKAAKKDGKIKVLLVPGHEPNFGGAEYNGMKERDINLTLAKDLERFLKRDKKYEVAISRDADNWNPELAEYFNKNWEQIKTWTAAQKVGMAKLITAGKVSKIVSPPHGNANPNPALRLYGINKWSSENDFDIVFHIHFNDDTMHKPGVPGSFSGFSIYVPERQYSNSRASKAIADNVFRRLFEIIRISNLPQESLGIMEDQELIAVGGYNTSDTVSILVEYGYIYEDKLWDVKNRETYLNNAAYQTYLGFEDFFKSK